MKKNYPFINIIVKSTSVAMILLSWQLTSVAQDGQLRLAQTNDNPSQPFVKAYPNPFNSVVTFEYSLRGNAGKLLITDLLGRVILESELKEPSGSVTWTPRVSQGVYLYRILTDQGLEGTGKIVSVK